MDHHYDAEFLEDGHTIELISLGMVAADGREFYAVNGNAPWDRIAEHDWLRNNVVPSLLDEGSVYWDADADADTGRRRLTADWTCGHVVTRAGIAAGVVDHIGNDPFARLWAYYGAYDHVALCQLWGRMIDLPRHVPMWTHDLMMERERRGNPALPEQVSGHHNALADARWNRDTHAWLLTRPLAPSVPAGSY